MICLVCSQLRRSDHPPREAMKITRFFRALVFASLGCTAIAHAQQQEKSQLDQVVVTGASLKSSISFRRLLTYHKRWLEIPPDKRELSDLSFFLMPKRGVTVDPRTLKLLLVSKDNASPIGLAADFRLDVPFDKYLDDERAEVYSNVDLEKFERPVFVTLKLEGESIPMAEVSRALDQATRAYRGVYNPFASAKRVVGVSFAPGTTGSVHVSCPGTENAAVGGAARRYIRVPMEDRWLRQQCLLRLSQPALRLFAE